MNAPRAWSLITMGTGQQYAGNRGYEDDPRRIYRYDSNVANCRNVRPGDLALIRNRAHLIGIARIEKIASGSGRKTMLRCPVCHNGNLKTRVKKTPRFRCGNGHEFEVPQEEVIDVTTFEATYSGTYVQAPDAVPVSAIKAAAPRRSDQLSIEEVDVSLLEQALLKSFPPTRAVLAAFYQSISIDSRDALQDADTSAGPDGNSQQTDTFRASIADTRQAVLRTIRQRRGQKRFRDSLISRYGPQCMLTRCDLLDVLEAAHVWPCRGQEDNHPENGLLLRADIHTLFDLDHLAIDPDTLTVRLSPVLARTSSYGSLAGIALKASPTCRPARDPLLLRWQSFVTRWDRAD
jgi:putative restriction endonuclease